jgi:hypothetical protein
VANYKNATTIQDAPKADLRLSHDTSLFVQLEIQPQICTPVRWYGSVPVTPAWYLCSAVVLAITPSESRLAARMFGSRPADRTL